MKKFRAVIGLVLCSLTFGTFSIVQSNKNKKSEIQEADAYTAVSTYYSSVSGTGTSLLTSINTRINQNLSRVNYDNLKSAYISTDVRSDGKLYDIYSNNTSYVPGSNFAGSYQNVGDGYNREHTIPQSWWSSGTTKQGCDLYIVLPSDAKANGMRSNYPYGICSSGTEYKLSGDPSGNRLGTSSNTSYVSGTVFEPFDDRKGDFARIYFYAVAMYWSDGSGSGGVKTWTSGDGSKVFSNSGNNGFVQKYLNMLLAWHNADPVSQWEITRNNNVENAQGNRNPFVDHPSWVDLIWGGTYTSSGLNYENTSNGAASVVNGQISGGSGTYVTMSQTSASVSVGNTVNLTATSSNGAAITWSTSSSSIASISSTSSASGSGITVTGVAAGAATITATSTAGSATCTVTVTSSGGGGGGSSGELTINGTASGITTTDGSQTVTVDSKSFGGSFKQYDTSALWFTNGSGYIYNTTDLGRIDSITINYRTGGSATAYQWISLGTSALSSYSQSTTNGVEYTTSSGGSHNTFEPTGDYGFFNISVSNRNLQATSIVITYSSGGSSSQKTLSSIAVQTAPTKTTYTAGEYFDPTGLVITRNYSDSTSDTYTYANHTSEFTFNPSPSTALTTSNASVTITYSGKTTTQAITVNEAIQPASGSSNKFALYSGDLTEGDYVIVYDGKAMNTTVTSNRLQYDTVTITDGIITSPNTTNIWHIAPSSGSYWNIYNESADVYAASTGTKNQAGTLASGTDNKSLWTVEESSGTYEFTNKNNSASSVNALLRENETYGFACYSSSTGGKLSLYKRLPIDDGKYYLFDSTKTYGMNASSGNTMSSPSAVSTSSSYTVNAFNFVWKSGTSYEVSVTINNSKYYLVNNNISTSGNNTNIRITTSPTSLKSTYWEITAVSGGYQLKQNTTGTTYRYLTLYNSSTWCGYTNTSSGNAVVSLVVQGTEIASIATSINDLTCNNGVTPPSTSSWSTISTNYGNIKNTAEKELLTNATANQSGTALEQAAAKYDYIVNKYGTSSYNNFANRNVGNSNSAPITVIINDKFDYSTIAIIVISITAFVLVGTYFVFRRRKVN